MRAVKRINSKDVFKEQNESHYAINTQIDSSQYPQIHDFHEFVLIISGKMNLGIGDRLLSLKEGSLFWIRPGDVHSKLADGPCTHINLAFPQRLVEILFQFMDEPDILHKLQDIQDMPYVSLTPNRKNMILHKLEKLHLVPLRSKIIVKAELRVLLAEIIMEYFVPLLSDDLESEYLALPTWFSKLLDELNRPEHFTEGTDYIFSSTGRSSESVCRAFRRYLGITATEYLNNIRLNYAANLLLHTDKKILDIALESGFQSLSYFYHLFRLEYALTPYQFRSRLSGNQG